VVLLGTIGPALTFIGASAYWEKAIQGGIILTAVVVDALRAQTKRRSEANRQGLDKNESAVASHA
jgi:rhamnose transport system permease protein